MTSPGLKAPDPEPAAAGAEPRLYERAYGILADQIAQGAIPAGAALLEARVAERFGISRAPARQALAQLERDGWLLKRDGRGYIVAGDAVGRREAAAAPPPMRLTSAASWERIHREVEAEIAARISFASWRITETDLAGHYGVSRTVARDVLARLQQRGLVRKDDRSRWLVPALTPDYVGELYELRWILEPVALAQASGRVPPGFFAAMRRDLEDALARADTIGSDVLDRLEEQMHVALLGHCANATLTEALRLYQSLLIAHRFLYGAAPRLYPVEPFLPEHLAVVERLEAGHVAEAASRLELHLKLSRDRAIQRISTIARVYDPKPLPYLVPIDAR